MRPFKDLTEAEQWRELAACCMGCGCRRDPVPEIIDLWMCPTCISDFHLALSGSHAPDNRFVHMVPGGTDPFQALDDRLRAALPEPRRENALPPPVSGSEGD